MQSLFSQCSLLWWINGPVAKKEPIGNVGIISLPLTSEWCYSLYMIAISTIVDVFGSTEIKSLNNELSHSVERSAL